MMRRRVAWAINERRNDGSNFSSYSSIGGWFLVVQVQKVWQMLSQGR